MVFQYVQHTWKMKECLGITISVYLENIYKLFMLLHHLLFGWQISHAFPYATLLEM